MQLIVAQLQVDKQQSCDTLLLLLLVLLLLLQQLLLLLVTFALSNLASCLFC